jgi:hypothetical protein
VFVRPDLSKVRLFLSGWLIHLQSFVSLAQTRQESDLQNKEKAMFRNFKVLFVVFVVIAIAGSAYAFAAANTVPATNAGYAASVVSGYTVDSIVYDLDDDAPTVIAKITFDINPTTGSEVAKFVQIQTATSGSWTTCTLAAGTAPEIHVTCTPTSLNLVDATALNVVASSSLNPSDL